MRSLRGNSLRIGTGNLFRPNRELNGGIRELFGRIREEALARVFLPRSPRYKGPRRYCRPGVLFVNPARRNASAIASPLADPGLIEPAPVQLAGKPPAQAGHGQAR